MAWGARAFDLAGRAGTSILGPIKAIGRGGLAAVRAIGSAVSAGWNRVRSAVLGRDPVRLHYFDEILPVEFAAIETRRAKLSGRSPEPRREAIGRNPPPPPPGQDKPEGLPPSVPAGDMKLRERPRSPDPGRLFQDAANALDGRFVPSGDFNDPKSRARDPDPIRTRPKPVPCTATGLALSGGGIRSAAVCLGALQSLHNNGRLSSFDYMSTVSGGGYMGACLSAAMSPPGRPDFPFGADKSDSPAVAHLRNYSNYLLPRGRSGVRNLGEAGAVILRGLLANAVIVLTILLGFALLTAAGYPGRDALGLGSLPPRIVDGIATYVGVGAEIEAFLDTDLSLVLGSAAFGSTLLIAVLLSAVLLGWAVFRPFTFLDWITGDTTGIALKHARLLLIALIVVAFLDLQPLAIRRVVAFHDSLSSRPPGRSLFEGLPQALAALAAFSAAVATFAGRIGRFLEASRRARAWRTLLLRFLVEAMVIAAGLVLPILLWVAYLWLSAWAVAGWDAPVLDWRIWNVLRPPGVGSDVVAMYWTGFAVAGAISIWLRPNAYSLHRFYRDRLSKAFLFKPPDPAAGAEPEGLDRLKLSEMRESAAPYHIINTAMNVQGSAEANRRGRNADFFMFSPSFVGSDLTLYAGTRGTAATEDMETIDSQLDLATAMAISGAAVSANMGSQTIRTLSPTLALLNVRLGYWLRNPRDLARRNRLGKEIGRFSRALREKFYLLAEMMNLHDEKSREVYLTDGGHIENLGLYELLKRGCRFILVVDAEADPEMSFSSLLKLERYARIDLGVRIILPWEAVADVTRESDARIAARERPCRNGPHCAVGRILYEDGAEGAIVYFKCSTSGDEKDYLLDYKVRHASFPHETTGDQFFTEEQFEMYRALGFHMVDGFFTRADRFSYLTRWQQGFQSADAAWEEIERLLPQTSAYA